MDIPTAVPPHDEPHSPIDYRVYHDPLYYPDLYPDIFSTHEVVSEWIKMMMIVKLGPLLPVSDITVIYMNDHFTIIDLNAVDSIQLSVSDVFGPRFSVSSILQHSSSPA
jgi:hypothetical protein